MKSYKIKIATFPIAKAIKKISFLDPLYNVFVGFCLSFYKTDKTSFRNSVISDDEGGIFRDSRFFDYKSYANNKIIAIEGICIWLKVDGSMLIGDIEKISKENLGSIIKKLKRLCFFIGCNEISINLSPDCYLDRYLRDKYVAIDGLPIGYLDLSSGIDLSKIKYMQGDFDTF